MIALLIFIVIARSPNSSLQISCSAIFPFSTFFLTLGFIPDFFLLDGGGVFSNTHKSFQTTSKK